MDSSESGGHGITRAAGAVSFGVLVSRLLGFVRDMIIAKLFGAGMYADAGEANRIAEAALADASRAAAIAEKQRFFVERIFSRKDALEQAVWLRTLVVQRKNKRPSAGGDAPATTKKRRLFRSLRLFRKRSQRT